MTPEEKARVQAAIDLAFEAGRWLGQVDLEEHFDNEQYAQCAFESLVARRTSMPAQPPSTNRSVTVNLRSEIWRQGVIESSNQYLTRAKKMAIAE